MSHLTENERKAIQLFKQQLFEEFPDKVAELKLFGSKARGESSKFSDVDIWVVLNDGNWRLRDPIHEIATDVFMKTSVDLSLHIFTTENIQRMRETGSPLLMNVREEGVVI